jgi:hypothetical protein
MAASATGGGQSRELRRKLSLERRVASRRRRPRTLPLGRLRPPPPAEERSCATYTYIVKPRLIVARFHRLEIRRCCLANNFWAKLSQKTFSAIYEGSRHPITKFL